MVLIVIFHSLPDFASCFKYSSLDSPQDACLLYAAKKVFLHENPGSALVSLAKSEVSYDVFWHEKQLK